MTTAIATRLALILDGNTELIELSKANESWQKKINQAVRETQATNTPIYLLFPPTIAILAEIVKEASQQQWRILICGNGSKLNWGNPSTNIQLVVSTQKCDRLIEHAVGDLTVTVEAGMKLVDLQAKLRSHDQFLPIDPSYPETATLGGIVATADTGSWRQRYGGVRDLLLGLSFVRADGEIAKAGGRVVKNVAGYDLMKLFTGAYGTLGIISQLTFRTYPLIATSQTLLLTGKAAQVALACQTVRNSGLTPTALDLISRGILKQLELARDKSGTDIGLLIRWQTIAESIEQQVNQVKAIAEELNLTPSTHQNEAETELWQRCTDITSQPDSDTAVTCKIGIPPGAAVNFLQLEQVRSLDIAVRFHSSSGIGALQLKNADPQTISEIRLGMRQAHEPQGKQNPISTSFLTVLNAPTSVKQQLDIWGYTGNALETMQTIKNQFDPQNILNPNRFIV